MQHNTVTLIGMSGCGKTYLAQKLAASGFFHYSVDYEIAHILRGKILESVISKIKEQSPLFKNLHEKFAIKTDLSLVFDDLEIITTFVIPLDENGTVKYGKFSEHQNLYKQAEKLAMEMFSERAQNAIGVYGKQGFICDATGSICEVASENQKLISDLKNKSTVVYIKTGAEHLETLAMRAKTAIKPLLYNPEFLQSNLQEYYRTSSIGIDFEIDKSFFLWVFPRLLEFRSKSYEKLVEQTGGIMIDSSSIQNICDGKDFLDIIRFSS